MRNSAVILTLLSTMLVPVAAAKPAMPFKAVVVGDGPPIIFIPGLNSSGAAWNAVVDGLDDRYTCHVLTLAGFASEPPIEPPFLPTVRDGVLKYIDDRGLRQPIIIGHSLGGVLGLWLGVTAPFRIGRIVTIDGVPFLPGLTNPDATPDSIRSMALGMRDAVVGASASDRARQASLTLPMLVTKPEHLRMATEWAAASDPTTSGHALMEIMTTDLRPQVSQIVRPVLLIAPDAPEGIAPDRVRRSYRQQFAPIPDHHIVFIPKTRHFVMLDDPAAVLAAVNAFLK
jgi:N-formylmaleamate deformylase